MSQPAAVRQAGCGSFGVAEGATVAGHVVRQLQGDGVDTVFGIPTGEVAPFVEALRAQRGVRFVIACHEAGAVRMAEGYARAGGAPGVCLGTGAGPAPGEGAPVVVISGQGSTGGEDVPVDGGMHHVVVEDAGALPRRFGQALDVALGTPPAAVRLVVPAGVARLPVAEDGAPGWTSRRREPPVVTEEVRETLLLLAAAERPLLYLGGGARGAMEALGGELAGLLERMAVPVATSPRAKGIFPEESELSLGVLGRAGSPRAARYLEEGVDVLVVVGSRLEGWERPGSGQMLRARTVVRVDARPVPAGQGPVPRLPVVADAASFLGGLVQHGRTAEPPAAMRVALRRSALLRLRAEVPPVREPARPAAGPSPLPPQRAMAETNPSLRGEVDLYVDAGSCADWATHCLRVSAPARFFLAPRGAAPGWSCGAVIGGKAARPERGAVALVDGAAFLVNGVEVNTATRHGVGAVYLVLSEDGDGSPGCGGLAQLAEALGAAAYRVERAGQLARLLPAALSAAEAEQRPQVIVVRVDHRETLP